MRAAFVGAGNPTGGVGGAVNTVRNWLDGLLARGVDVDVICQGETDEAYETGGVTVVELAGFRPRERIERELETGEYDVVLTQNLWADVALEAADALGIPTVYLVHDTFSTREVVSEWSPTRFVANSRYTQQWITSVWGRDSTVVYPHIDFEFYDAPDGSSDAISMLNPVVMKGGPVFKRVARQLPDRKFLAKAGWYGLRNDDLSWNRDGIRLEQATFHGSSSDVRRQMRWQQRTFDTDPPATDDDELRTPTEVSFEETPNVTYTREPGILEFYARTGILTIPSQWKETFGRVALEAMWNGIPVVAHHRGGIPEACGGAALFVDDQGNPDAWVEKIRTLDDPDVYESFAKRGRARAERYRENQPEQTDALHTVLEAAAAEQ